MSDQWQFLYVASLCARVQGLMCQEPVGLWVTFLFLKDSKERCKVRPKVQNRKLKGVIIKSCFA